MCSTSDLVEAARCEFALLRALDAELGLVPPVAAPDPLPLPTTELDTLPPHLAAAATRIEPPTGDDPATMVTALTDADRRTIAALHSDAPVILDARFFDGEFTTGCALLIRTAPDESHDAPEPVDAVADKDGSNEHPIVTGSAEQLPPPTTSRTADHHQNHSAAHFPYSSTTSGATDLMAPNRTTRESHKYQRPTPHTDADHPAPASAPGDQHEYQQPTPTPITRHPAPSLETGEPHEYQRPTPRTTDHPAPNPATVAPHEYQRPTPHTADHPAPGEADEYSSDGATAGRDQQRSMSSAAAGYAADGVQIDRSAGDSTHGPVIDRSARYSIHGVAGAGSPMGTLIELAGVAEMLRERGFRVDPWLRVRLGDGAELVRDLATVVAVFRARRARLATILAGKQDELLPVQWGDRRYLACGHCPTCTAELVAGRDLLLVAGMRPGVRAQLRDAGITTVDRLAAADSSVSGVAAHTFSALSRQAEVQLQHERTGAAVYTVTDAGALGALPLPSPGDVFLAVTDTPGTAVGVGVSPAHHAEGGEDPVVLFHAFAIAGNDSADEGFDAADETPDLLEYLLDRQEHHPGMRIYHYRSPVRQLLARLCVRYGADEQIIDDLLGSLVDLYPILRSALIIGQRSYRLADLAVLFDARSETPCADLESECAHTLRLREWLRGLAAEHGVHPAPERPRRETEPLPAVEAALREFAFDFDESRSAAQRAAALTAATLAYHRRERQPLHWAHEDRLRQPIAEWEDAPGVLIADWGTVDTKWHSTGESPMRRYLTLTGRLGTGGAPRPGTPVLTVYDRPVPGMTSRPGRRATAQATILGCALDANFDDAVRVEELLPQGCEPYDELPVAIVPGPPGQDENIADALESAAHDLLVSLPEVPATAAFDLLLRRPPRLRSGARLPEVFGDHAAAVTAAVLDLDDSYVAVQGPSGTGKTDTAARVVERLVTRYKWRVGVVARSHWAVEQVLDALVRVGVLPELVAKSETHAVAPEWLTIEPSRYPRFLDNAVNGCVIGGLPGDFADAAQVPPGALDLLLIADAGHFSLADAIAVSGSAHNLLLLGDPAPLPGHGIHPEPVHDSTLGRLLGELPTLPIEFGYFLDRTWRMHPQLCGPVSRLRYAGRLRSSETVTLARDLEGVPPGVRIEPIEHHGNSTESAEEAREIVRRVRALLGLPWHQGAMTRRLHPHDILVVTPYHAQVARIRTLLSRARIEDVLVGTPERLAGREAAVVLISMTTSSPADAPHGIQTLLSRHWITTAVARAMWTAVIVHSALLTEYLPETPEELTDLAVFLRLADSEEGAPLRSSDPGRPSVV
ncbi:bifunctional RecB family nuclease/DEAD/DEAH box helicase [Nocardia macrotermitis]|uniref:bifunctional RecB family nuclease/DEAD/DEAH box helicase n=1 Tax=Nocardia macrotermitis TaxID=2585198 RepID=UPI0029E7ED46|nr:AAA domain-containing protein [Nocardia macrotermitis]